MQRVVGIAARRALRPSKFSGRSAGLTEKPTAAALSAPPLLRALSRAPPTPNPPKPSSPPPVPPPPSWPSSSPPSPRTTRTMAYGQRFSCGPLAWQSPVKEVGGEEVQRQDPLRLRPKELRHARHPQGPSDARLQLVKAAQYARRVRSLQFLEDQQGR
jgi:hypothetical protein